MNLLFLIIACPLIFACLNLIFVLCLGWLKFSDAPLRFPTIPTIRDIQRDVPRKIKIVLNFNHFRYSTLTFARDTQFLTVFYQLVRIIYLIVSSDYCH